MLAIHSIDGQQWEKILHGVPPHLYGVVAAFARDHARVWAGVADQLENQATELAVG